MLPFAIAIFSGAFLLFQVQPLIGKYILPWFGGGPGVWTTCLLFFQLVLLGGYAYAHVLTTYLKPRRQVIVHCLLLVASLALLPITPSDSWKTHVEGDPTWHILLLLLGTIGLPYFVLSSTGPLMQRWFSETNPGVSPYRLYALSNIGSLLALLSYPFFFEVHFTRKEQGLFWSGGLVVFVLFAAFCGSRVWRNDQELREVPVVPADEPRVEVEPAVEVTWTDRVLWLALPAVASLVLLATTNKLCQEVAVIPFLWVLPLSLYLITFIVSFDHARWYHRGVWFAIMTVSVGFVTQLVAAGNDAPMAMQIVGYNVALLAVCMVCHGELYRLRPPPAKLTGYFLSISAGGAFGGFLVAVVAPAVLTDYRELQIGLWMLSYLVGTLCYLQRSRSIALGVGVGAILMTVIVPVLRHWFGDGLSIGSELMMTYRDYGAWVAGGLILFVVGVIDFKNRRVLTEWQPRMAGFVMAMSVMLAAIFIIQWREKQTTPVLAASRNFYGTLKVFNYSADDPDRNYHLLLHGATTHGLQFVSDERRNWPTTYYGETSGVGLAIKHLPEGPRRLGLVGLGTGTLASYGQAGDYMRIYEINPAVRDLTETIFSYTRDTPAEVEIAMGDARLSMEHELEAGNPQQFDLLALDAFSSDAIPVHLLTKEAFEIYLKHMKPNGVIAVHISNRYLDLRPIVEALAKEFDLGLATIPDDYELNWWVYRTTWILLTRDKAFLEIEEIKSVAEESENLELKRPLWTDDYASLYEILK